MALYSTVLSVIHDIHHRTLSKYIKILTKPNFLKNWDRNLQYMAKCWQLLTYVGRVTSIWSYLIRVLRKIGPRLANSYDNCSIFRWAAPTLNHLWIRKKSDFHPWYIQTQQNIASPLCFGKKSMKVTLANIYTPPWVKIFESWISLDLIASGL